MVDGRPRVRSAASRASAVCVDPNHLISCKVMHSRAGIPALCIHCIADGGASHLNVGPGVGLANLVSVPGIYAVAGYPDRLSGDSRRRRGFDVADTVRLERREAVD